MKRILVLNFFPAFTPPSSGGELRYYNLYSRLSRHFDITLLSPTYSDHKREVITHSTTFREHRIPKEAIHDQLHMQIYKEGVAAEVSALVCSLSARYPNVYHQEYLELQVNADLIIHESPYMLDYDLLLGLDRRPRIYNSYNVESDLVSQVWKGPYAQSYLDHIIELESRLIAASDLCFAVSTDEAQLFSVKYNVPLSRFCIAENGIAPEEFLPRTVKAKQRLEALFFGSLHPPNIEAANFIVNELSPMFPQIDFIIAGSCMKANMTGLPANVKTLGKVDNDRRLQLFATADIALNPMLSGAGTNLKALEFLAAKLPMLSTPLGARGLDLVNEKHALIATHETFHSALQKMTKSPDLRKNLAESGTEHVIHRFSWDAIADRTAKRIQNYLSTWQPPLKRNLLVLNDFSAATPRGGGEVRINRIYSALAKYYQITMVCFTGRRELQRIEVSPGFIELHVPKTQKHRKKAKSYCWKKVSADDIVNYQEGPKNPLLSALVKAFYPYNDAVILSHPYMSGLLKGLSGRPVIYESHNVETELKGAILNGHPNYQQLVHSAEECERLAISFSSEIVLCSENDREGMIRLSADPGKLHIVSHGVDVSESPPQRETLEHIRSLFHNRPIVVFIGSAHPPNISAADHILNKLSPAMPDCSFVFIGSVCNAFPLHPAPNVFLLGCLDDQTKNVAVELADIAINPIISGSGSNLKLAEYFSKALPTVTTPFGARGYDIQNGEHAVICDLYQFPHEIRTLMKDNQMRLAMSERAYNFAKTFLDWQLQAGKFQHILEQRIFLKKRLLVVTYRFTEPPLGGGETYLLELLRQLDCIGDFSIDVATLDIVKIKNHFHFSSCYEHDKAYSLPSDFKNLTVHRFPVDEIPEDIRLQNSRRLFSMWMEEFRKASLLHLSKLPDTILLGGWYFPEKTAAGVEIWSSPKALLRAKGVSVIILRGYSPVKNQLRIAAGNQNLLDTNIKGNFDLKVATQNNEIVELHIENAYLAPNDPRPLGLRFREILVQAGTENKHIPLDVNYRDILKQTAPEDFIQSLIDTAHNRSPEMDELLQNTRGPNSEALKRWLNQNTRNYDLVLGHSVPFKTIVVAADCARAANVPLVQLPHFHIDDEYYHWQSYYQALKEAVCCITHPKTANHLFFDRIGANGWYLPFGIDIHEKPSKKDENAFNELYSSELPFVMVLGRKSGAKNYQHVISALAGLNINKRACNMVMIGRDEDEVPLDPDLVIYLGGQPRGIVLAALKRCLCLISMSDSESFGIVILEAWSQSRPVIVSENCHASVELVTDGKNGLLASATNLHEKIKILIDNPMLAERLGQAGHERLCEEFSWESIGTALNRKLLSVVDSGKKNLPEQNYVNKQEMIKEIKILWENNKVHENDFLFFRNFKIKRPTILDIGANAGQSVISFKLVLPDARIISFEPNTLYKPVLDYVQSSIFTPQDFTYYMLGAGDTERELELIIPIIDNKPYFQEASVDVTQFEKSWVKNRFAAYGNTLEFERINIRMVTLDQFNFTPDIIKIDAEGSELSVLKGMIKTIRSYYPIFLIENNDWHNVTAYLKNLGYEVYNYNVQKDTLFPIESATTNCFYLRPEHFGLIL
jgi:FkbM family methyltransferase